MATRPARPARPLFERLEPRLALSSALPNLDMISATTADSKGVTIAYQVQDAAVTRPFDVAIVRSGGPSPTPGAATLVDATLDPNAPDAAGRPLGALGEHTLTIPVAGGLPPDPAAPYVVAVANPSGALPEATLADNSASFRVYILGVVVHGGIQESSHVPAWANKLASMLRGVGYDDVLAFNWAAQSTTAGDAVKQGPKLAAAIRRASESFPESSVVDLHLIGHSEGAVVVSQALLGLQRNTTPQLRAGYVKVTLLDPHAANNNAPGGQVSVAHGISGAFAKFVIKTYQSWAKDPLVAIPSTVSDAEVYYQHTPVQLDHANHGLYNLWGEVPIKGQARYADLTGPRMAHSGGGGVQVWYAFHVVPTLRDGGNAFVDPTALTAARLGPGGEFAGTAAPGASIALLARRPGSASSGGEVLGRAVADARGDWSIAAGRLPRGARFFARVEVPEGMPSPRAHLFRTVPVAGA